MNEKEIRRFYRRRFSPLSWFLLGYYVLLNVAVIVSMVIHQLLFNPTEAELMGNAWGYLVASAIGMAILLIWKKLPFWRDGVWEHGKAMKVTDFVILLVLTVGCQMGASLYGVVLELLLNTVGLSAFASIESATAGADTISMFLYAGVCAPVVEELIFRGFVQQTLKPYGKKFAIFGSALLFGLFHGNLFQSPYAFLVGLVFGYVAMEYSIAWAMLLHMFNNLVLGDTLTRLMMALPEILQSLLMMAITYGCGIAAIVLLVNKKHEIRGYLWTSPMDKHCVRGLLLNWGFILLALMMAANMILMILP